MEKKYLVIGLDSEYNQFYLRPDNLEYADFGDNVIWYDTYENIFNIVSEDSKKYDYKFEIIEFDEK